ncbi:IQ calmodulin-binding motif protein (macronuclear) [Tetrahymena thermophila SB210]|uniref:IQ calmodulin-binding motif protein n=1 Tax=Tetrahymena thermophila (strain SB210) TaxID=312017 RepID=A4VDX2_TETTS|nr:IQ calmodulin-binding motif protein [Tetrahymena thermophila SB210]EDK31720.2 IQ calmodulin-binding motif protein [Tetrahymena thermophila SB210]|eukprot:XP_001470784.2 IQ calmodulin-binding motif protein [Tetrahymena thermophila SB210]
MIKYKSLKTYERLKQIQIENPVFELSERDEIDQKLQLYCNQFKQKVFPDGFIKDTQKQAGQQEKAPSQENQKKVYFKEQLPTTAQNIPSVVEFGENFQSFIDNKFKLQLQRNMNKENSVVKMFGNALIATVFQSLVIKTIESLYKIHINIETDIPISSNVLKAFDISTIVLSSFKTQQEKADYILSCMDKTISQMFNSFKEKQEVKEKKQEEQDKKDAKKQNQKAKDDHFPWLRVKTKYESLRKKLNTSIIEKLNDYENLVLVLEKLKEKQELKKQGKDTQASNVKYVLKNITPTSTKDIFQNMSKYGNPRTQQFLSRLGLSDKHEKLQNASQLMKKQKQSLDEIRMDDAQLDDEQEQISTDSKNINSEEPLSKVQNFWDQNKEKAFKQCRQEKKQLYSNEVASSSWNEVGFLPFVQKYIIEMKKSMQRDHLLDRYADGEWLTAEELKLLANTSELLNSCIDRKFMQSAVDVIDKDIIQNLELGLAEDILKNYEEIQIAIKKSRQEFIKNSLQKSYEKLRQYDQKKQKQWEQYQNKEYHAKKQKMFTAVCYKLEREGKFKEKPPENLQGAESLKLFLEGKIDQDEVIKDLKNINYYAEELESEINNKKKEREQKKQQEEQWKKYLTSISEPKQQLNDKFYKSVTRHYYHPPSKIFIQDEHNAQDYTPEEMEKYSELNNAMKVLNKNEQEKYKINLKAHIAFKNPYTFKNFYSGGPAKPIREEPLYKPLDNQETKVNPRELRYIIMIQKKFRQHRQQKKMKEVLETKEKDKYYEYKFKIEQIRHLTKQNIKIQQTSDKAKDIQIINLDEEPQVNTPMTQQHKDYNNENLSGNMFKERKQTRSGTLNQGQKLKRPLTGISTNDQELIEQGKKIDTMANKSTDFFQNNNNNNNNNKSTFANTTRPRTALSQGGKLFQSTKSLSQSKVPQSFTHSTHYTSIFNIDENYSTSEFKRNVDQLATKPIEQQLRNVKLIEAAKNNRFWAVNTGKFIFCRRDFYLARDKIGQTALHWAVYHRNTEFIQWLIDQGSDPNAPDCNGNTPVHVAFQSDKMEVIMMIINQGGDLNNLNVKGETPLVFGSQSMLKLLNLTKGVTQVGQHTSETNFDNNKLLKFFTQEDFNQMRIASYGNRFNGKKSQKYLGIDKENDQKISESKSLKKSESLAQLIN